MLGLGLELGLGNKRIITVYGNGTGLRRRKRRINE